MKSLRVFCISFLVVVAASVAADDLALVRIGNRFQESIVQATIDRAYTRVDGRLLVSLSAQQADQLLRAGVEYEYVMLGFDENQTSLVQMPDRGGKVEKVPSALGTTINLNDGLMLATIDREACRAINETSAVRAALLADLKARIVYVPEAVANLAMMLDDFPSDSLADLISMDSLTAMCQRMQDFQTRYIWSDSINAARDWIAQKFQSWGYTNVTLPSFYYYGTLYNVMCVKQGYAEPDKVIVIGGHYDSITYGQPQPPEIWAPGADDDASGTVLTMELARVLADIPLRKTIIFMPFSAEEVGLVGSRAAAQQFANDGTDVEVMLNFDMVAYEPNANWSLNVSSGPNTAYRTLMANTLMRVSNITPVIVGMGSSSDHYAFYEQGFNIVDNIENTFNYNAWHTATDIVDSMNLPYWTDVARSAVATLAIIANAAHPTDIEQIIDMGDGYAVEVFWTDCDPTYSYSIHYGPAGVGFTDSVAIPSGECSWIVDGLTTGVEYTFGVIGTAPGGYAAVYASSANQTPLVIPRVPAQVSAEPELNQVHVNWADNQEADIDHYRLYRGVGGLPLALYQDMVATSEFFDSDVIGQVGYHYVVIAVDQDGYESDVSSEVAAYAATFDGGVLIADDMKSGSGMPTEANQLIYFDSLMGDVSFVRSRIDTTGARLTRNDAGQYSSILWFDDDLSHKLIGDSEDTLGWYTSYSANVMITGLRTLEFWQDAPIPVGHLLYDEFLISDYEVHAAYDFAGGIGVGGWPNAITDTTTALGNLPFVVTLTIRPGGIPIFTYDSKTDAPASEGKPCGVLYSGPDGYRILLGFPLYWMTDESAKAVVAYALNLMGESGAVAQYGDLDGNGRRDIVDLVYMVDFMFQGGPAPLDINSADVDGSCRVDISDLVYYVSYLFQAGPEPVAGCVVP
jgi:hypothetical protein